MRAEPEAVRVLDLARRLFDDPRPPLELLLPPHDPPSAMDDAERQALTQILAVGALSALARGGGARIETRPVDGALVRGRLWERHPPEPLAFSPWTVELLFSLLDTPLRERPLVLSPPTCATPADQLLAAVVARTLLAARAMETRAFDWSPLASLAHPARRVDVDLGSLLAHPWLVEGQLDALASDWERATRALWRDTDPGRIFSTGQAMSVTLQAVVLQWADRRDLLEWGARAAARLFASPPVYLDPPGPLRARAEALDARLGLVWFIEQLAQGIEADRAVRFFDEQHAEATARLARWEQSVEPVLPALTRLRRGQRGGLSASEIGVFAGRAVQ